MNIDMLDKANHLLTSQWLAALFKKLTFVHPLAGSLCHTEVTAEGSGFLSLEEENTVSLTIRDPVKKRQTSEVIAFMYTCTVGVAMMEYM